MHTLGASDVINGNAGTDKIIITMAGTGAPAAADNLVPRMSNVEQVFAQSLFTGSTINMVNATGVQELWSDNSTNSLAITNLQEKATIGVKGGNGSAYTVAAATTAARAGDLAIALDKANVGNLFVNQTGLAGAAGYTSTTINAAAGSNTVGALDAGSALATVKVTGEGSLAVTGNLAATVRTIDASANKGGVNLNITNNTGNVVYTGGEGNDRINFGATLGLQDKVDGGAGRDILGVDSQARVISGLQVSNVEILELATLDGTLEAARIAGVDEVRVTTTLSNGANVAIVNGLTSNSTFVTNDAGDVQLNLVDAQVAGTNDTLNLKTGLAANGTVSVMAAGVENIVYTDNVVANTGRVSTVTFRDNDGVVDVTNLTIAGNAGNTVNFNGLVNTIRTVDASAANGIVNISIADGNPTNGVSITGGAGADTLTGGAGKDVIKGGAGNDTIQGDVISTATVAQSSTATFVDAAAGTKLTITFNGTAYDYTVAVGGEVAADLAAKWATFADAGGATLGAAVAAAGVTGAAAAAVLTLTGATSVVAPKPFTLAASATVALEAPTAATTAGTNAVITASSDTLTGGDGSDTFVLVGQSGGWDGTKLTNMDVITDLNLGGATNTTGVDAIQFSSVVLGNASFNAATSLVNAGTALAMTGPTFEAGLQGLFNAGGALNGATNNVGLFTYGSDTYLIAANAVAGLDANDVVIKVTGVTGTLDLSDLAII